MKPDIWTILIDYVFKLSMGIACIWAVVLISKDINKRKVDEAKEKALGAEAMQVIKKEIAEMRLDISSGKANEEGFKRVVDRLQQDYDFLMKRFFEYFKPIK